MSGQMYVYTISESGYMYTEVPCTSLTLFSKLKIIRKIKLPREYTFEFPMPKWSYWTPPLPQKVVWCPFVGNHNPYPEATTVLIPITIPQSACSCLFHKWHHTVHTHLSGFSYSERYFWESTLVWISGSFLMWESCYEHFVPVFSILVGVARFHRKETNKGFTYK